MSEDSQNLTSSVPQDEEPNYRRTRRSPSRSVSISEPTLTQPSSPSELPKKPSFTTRAFKAASGPYDNEKYVKATAHFKKRVGNPIPECSKRTSDMVAKTAYAVITTILVAILLILIILLVALVYTGSMSWNIALIVFIVGFLVLIICIWAMKSYLASYLGIGVKQLNQKIERWMTETQTNLPDIVEESLTIYEKEN